VIVTAKQRSKKKWHGKKENRRARNSFAEGLDPAQKQKQGGLENEFAEH
jgi:hypothetical protein